MLLIATKDWLANNAGSAGCFASAGITYSDPDGISRTGGTGDVLNAFYVAHLLGKDSQVIKAGATYTSLKATNGGNDLILDDVSWAYANDGAPTGEPKYCASGQTPTPTPVPTPTPAPGAPIGQFEFTAPPQGVPTVTLDLSALGMKQNSSDQHFEMNTVKITNTSAYTVYLATEVRLFGGVQLQCPAAGEIFKGLDRVSTTKAQRIRVLNPGEAANYNLDFYQPPSILGVHTVCLYIHGSYDRDALEDEIAPITG